MHVCRWRMTNIQCCLSISRGVIQLVSELESISPSLLHLPSGPSPFHLSVITFPRNLTSSDCYECWHLNILSHEFQVSVKWSSVPFYHVPPHWIQSIVSECSSTLDLWRDGTDCCDPYKLHIQYSTMLMDSLFSVHSNIVRECSSHSNCMSWYLCNMSLRLATLIKQCYGLEPQLVSNIVAVSLWCGPIL